MPTLTVNGKRLDVRGRPCVWGGEALRDGYHARSPCRRLANGFQNKGGSRVTLIERVASLFC